MDIAADRGAGCDLPLRLPVADWPGPYDRRGQTLAPSTPAPVQIFTGGGAQLMSTLPGPGPCTLSDFLTYDGVADLPVPRPLTDRCAPTTSAR